MYANFIYFILVLLIYTTYYPPEKPYVGSLGTACLFGLGVVFLVLTSKLTSNSIAGSIDRPCLPSSSLPSISMP
jgi:hypothetical protein